MKTKTPNRPLSREEGFSMISDYFESGLGSSAYFRTHDISEWQFYKWRKLYLQEHPELRSFGKTHSVEKRSSFACLEIKEIPLSSAKDCSLPSIEIHYPNGIRLCIGEGLKQLSSLAELLTLSISPSCSR